MLHLYLALPELDSCGILWQPTNRIMSNMLLTVRFYKAEPYSTDNNQKWNNFADNLYPQETVLKYIRINNCSYSPAVKHIYVNRF